MSGLGGAEAKGDDVSAWQYLALVVVMPGDTGRQRGSMSKPDEIFREPRGSIADFDFGERLFESNRR